jgi:hypothetical protein
MKWLREPLVHFLFIGAALFVLYEFVGKQDTEDPERVITITAGEIDWLTGSWKKRWNRPPTEEERKALIKHYIREMILYREALAMGLDQNDTIIRRRLAQKLEFLTQDLIRPQPPTEDDLQGYFKTHMDRYQSPSLITLTHVFLDPDKRGNQTLQDAETLKAKLIALKQPLQDAGSFGDPFMLQSYYPERSEVELSKLFGRGFAEPLFKLAPQEWHGPVLSGYGVHLVYVHARQDAEPPKFESVAEQVQRDWENDQREQLNEQYITNLMARYEVIVEDVPVDEKARQETIDKNS